MKKQQEERLFFHSKCPEDLEKTLERKGKLNPYTIIAQSTQNSQTSAPSIGSKTGGKFAYDVLLGPKTQAKGKAIVKQDKRAHYRTKMCPYGRQCRRRMSCTYAHNEQELRKPFKNRKEMCKLYQLGKCQLGAACRDYHGNMALKKKNYKYQSELCKDFIEGKCALGRVCIYIHEMPEEEEGEREGVVEEEEREVAGVKVGEEVKVMGSGCGEVQGGVQAMGKDGAGDVKANRPGDVVEVKQEKIGAEQVLQDGLSFTFS